MSFIKKTPKLILSCSVIVALILAALVPMLISVGQASAASGDTYAYFWDGNNTTLDICQASSSCDGAATDIATDFSSFSFSSNVGTNQSLFTGVDLASNDAATITVNSCSPSQGVLKVPDQNLTKNITVGNYSGVSSDASAYGLDLSCTQGGQTTGGVTTDLGGGSVGVTAIITGVPNSATTAAGSQNPDNVGPISFQLKQGSTVVTTINSNSTPVSDGGQLSLTGNFAKVANGTYTVCSPDMTPAPLCSSSVTVAGNPTGVVLTGPVNASAYTAGTNGGTATDPCDSNNFSLGWMVCPFVDVLQKGVAAATAGIDALLDVNVNDYFNDSCVQNSSGTNCSSDVTGSCYLNNDGVESSTASETSCATSITNYNLWSYMRDIALSLLVIVALVMVIATALDIGPFDAYTVKKVLPRIFVSVILITFSWEIGRLLVQLSDALGDGVGDIIYSVIPGGASGVLTGLGDGVYAWLGIGGAVAAGGTLVAVATVGPLALLLLLLPAFLAVALGFLILILRRLVIVVCVVLAPIAFISFVLPGTQKVFKVWKDTFSGALLLFPMITAVIALGGVGSYLADHGDAGSSFIQPLIALIFFFAPFFLLPKLARSSTGALGTLSNGVLNAGQKGFQGLTQSRKKAFAERRERSKAGNLWSERNAFTRAMGGLSVGMGTGARGHYGFGKQGKAVRTLQEAANVEANLKNNARLMQLGLTDDNSNALLALSGGIGSDAHLEEVAKKIHGGNGAADVAERARMISTVKGIGVNRGSSEAALTTMAQNKSRAIATGQYHLVEEAVQELSRGDANKEATLAQGFQFHSRNAGRVDLGGDWTSSAIRNSGLNAAQKHAAVTLDGLSRVDMQSVVRGHPNGVTAAMGAITQVLHDRTASKQMKEEAGLRLIELQNSLPFATTKGGQVIADGMAANGVTYEPQTVTSVMRDEDGKAIRDAAGQALTEQRQQVIPVAQQVAKILTDSGVSVTADQLTARAKTYDRDSMRDATMGGDPGGGAPPPTGAP